MGTGPHNGLVQLRCPFLYWTGQVRAQMVLNLGLDSRRVECERSM
jgi:hypothetical protein